MHTESKSPALGRFSIAEWSFLLIGTGAIVWALSGFSLWLPVTTVLLLAGVQVMCR